jgi:pimeloyl-ACP methyl ester carboxylesterase
MKLKVRLMTGLVLMLCLPAVAAQDDVIIVQDVTFQSGDVTLVGTLTLPDDEGPFPAVVLLSGSGKQNRDGEAEGFLPGYSPSRFLAEGLTPLGFAVLRYDERGVGQSTGEHYAASTADFADDAEAAIDFLLSRDDIDAQRIGLIGHSEGANIVAMVAARNLHVAFAISMAGQAVNGYDVLLAQTVAGAEANGASQEEIDAAVELGRTEWDMVLAEDWAGIDAMSREIFAAMPDDQRPDLDVQDALIAQQETFAKSWFSFFLKYNPADDWAQVNVPVLAIFAELDTQVPLEPNRSELEVAFHASGNPDFTIVTLEATNHLFQPGVETGAPQEYATLESEFVPELLQTITGWLDDHFQP